MNLLYDWICRRKTRWVQQECAQCTSMPAGRKLVPHGSHRWEEIGRVKIVEEVLLGNVTDVDGCERRVARAMAATP